MSVSALTALATIAISTALTLPGSAPARTLPIRSLATDESALVAISAKRSSIISSAKTTKTALVSLAKLAGQQRRQTWSCQDSLGTPRTKASASVWALPQSVAYRRWVVDRWQQMDASCHAQKRKRTIPTTYDWVTATALADRIFPGTRSWLLSCSSGEGGHGRFVMNNQGSPAGGWMQFYASTYYRYSGSAYADARARGYLVDASTNDWHHPLGQAITASYAKTHGGGGNWDGHIDHLCW